MFEIFCHTHLSHKLEGSQISYRQLGIIYVEDTNLVLVSIHSSQSTNMGEDVLQGVRQLEGIYVAETELNMCIDDKLCETKDFTA